MKTSNKLTLAAGGTLNNPGTVQVGAYENDGATVNGNAPILLGPTGLVISNLRLALGPGLAPMVKSSVDAPGTELILTWLGPPVARFGVESSSDLVHWTSVSAVVYGTTPGRFQANLGPASQGQVFYRLHIWTH